VGRGRHLVGVIVDSLEHYLRRETLGLG